MYKILILIENKVFVPYKDGMIINYQGKLEEDLSEWLQTKYSLVVVRSTIVKEIVFVHAATGDKKYLGNCISVSRAIEAVDQNETEIIKFLNDFRSRSPIKLQYGERNGKIVCISELSYQERGLKCGCKCPGCGAQLQARMGNKKQPHFAHNAKSCDTVSAQQTALHLLAKEIIEKEKVIMFPGIYIKKTDISSNKTYDAAWSKIPSELEYRKPKKVVCAAVTLETKVSNFVPDIIVCTSDRRCLVEIAVTHFVDEEKRAKIETAGIPLLEIDLSDYKGTAITRNQLREVLTNQTQNKKWIYNSLFDDALKWAEEEFPILYETAKNECKRETEEAIAKSIEREKKEKEREKNKKAAKRKIEKLFIPEKYKIRLLELKNDSAAFAALDSFHFNKSAKGNYPWFLNIPITGEMIFKCDRRIWQGAMFDKFVYYRRTSEAEKPSVNIERVKAWATKYQTLFQIDWDISSKTYAEICGNWKRVALLYDVIGKYLEYLQVLGFISGDPHGEAIVVSCNSIIPPNSKNATLLYEVLKRVDEYSPNIDWVVRSVFDLHHINTEIAVVTGSETENMSPIMLRRAIEYDEGKKEIQTKDFGSEEPIIDSYNNRWLLCEICGYIKQDNEMACYGGENQQNIGVCRNCSRKQ